MASLTSGGKHFGTRFISVCQFLLKSVLSNIFFFAKEGTSGEGTKVHVEFCPYLFGQSWQHEMHRGFWFSTISTYDSNNIKCKYRRFYIR